MFRMQRDYAFKFPLPHGLHARPASHLEEFARQFAGELLFVNERSGRSASLRSVLGLVGTDTRAGDPCRLVADGAEAEKSLSALGAYLSGTFLKCDEALPASSAAPGKTLLPRSLKAAGLEHYLVGTPTCGGLAVGRALLLESSVLATALPRTKPLASAKERARLKKAFESLARDCEEALVGKGGAEKEIAKAQLAMLRDPELASGIERAIDAGAEAACAVAAAIGDLSDRLRKAENAYLRERVLDLEDIGLRLAERLLGKPLGRAHPVLSVPSVVVADRLTPSRFLSLDRSLLRGLVLGHAGQTSHTVILARSFGIPTLTGVASAAGALRSGDEVIVDANLGLLIVAPTVPVRSWYERETRKLGLLSERLASQARRNAVTRDGHRLEVAANIGSETEAAAAFERGAEGIGLFRTEMLFLDRESPPSEDEQYRCYRAVVEAASGRPVIFRSLDIGGDKVAPFLGLTHEGNPFLGKRGVRLYADYPELMKTQFRALWRAAAAGPAKLMIPMVACLEELRLAKRLFEEARVELLASKTVCGASVPVGMMLEVPSVAFIMDELCEEAEFFSIGSNDLTQYLLAADRENARLGTLYSSFHPAFLRLLKRLVESAKARGRWIGLCGELGESERALPLLAGLGLDEISVAAPRIPKIKDALSRMDWTECERLLSEALRLRTQSEVRELLETTVAGSAPLLVPELVCLDLKAVSKAEAIRALVDRLQLEGRTERCAEVEEAVWRREETYSTGFGEGFALPHCKTDALGSNAIVVGRLATPVPWDSLDGAPVDTVFLLGIRESAHGTQHLKTLARLSRLIMRDEFRAAIRAAATPEDLVRTVEANLEA